MSKNIVMCSDGTGNQDIKARGTNVYKLYEAVDIHCHKGNAGLRPQIAIYDDGVGTSSLLLLKVLGGAFGVGFCQNVQKMYRQLARVYVPGDHLYLFGFSRGAYTIRALAGMIQYCGITDISNGMSDPAVLHEHVEKCWDEFYRACFTTERDRKRKGHTSRDVQTPRKRAEKIERRRRLNSHEPDQPLNIELVGVWDTVGAVGMPVDELKHITDIFWPSRFNDLVPGEEIKRARHALALDDERQTFTPELWNETGETDPERVKQVWFAGAHSNVGGGYPKHGMSLVALDWMMAEAERAGPGGVGLRFIDADRLYAGTHQDVHDKLYDSRAGLGVYYRWEPRDVAGLCKTHGVAPRVHVTVFERIAMRTDGYAPGNIPYGSEVVVTEPSQWPGKPRLAEIWNRMSREGRVGSPLDRIKEDISSGRGSYRVFLVASLVGLFALATMVGLNTVTSLVGLPAIPLPEFLTWLAPTCTGGAWEPSCTVRAWIAALVLGSGIVVWFWSAAVDTSIDRKLTAFWEKIRGDLRQILHGETPSQPSIPQPVGTAPAAKAHARRLAGHAEVRLRGHFLHAGGAGRIQEPAGRWIRDTES